MGKKYLKVPGIMKAFYFIIIIIFFPFVFQTDCSITVTAKLFSWLFIEMEAKENEKRYVNKKKGMRKKWQHMWSR